MITIGGEDTEASSIRTLAAPTLNLPPTSSPVMRTDSWPSPVTSSSLAVNRKVPLACWVSLSMVTVKLGLSTEKSSASAVPPATCIFTIVLSAHLAPLKAAVTVTVWASPSFTELRSVLSRMLSGSGSVSPMLTSSGSLKVKPEAVPVTSTRSFSPAMSSSLAVSVKDPWAEFWPAGMTMLKPVGEAV